jgi:CheY-like chemotaxis protein
LHLKLPGAQPIGAQALDLGAGQRTVEPSALRGVRVLVVEDEADSRDTLCWILKLHGAESIPAASGAEALDLVQSARADILVCDIGLPDQDGYRLLKKIRQLPRAAGGAIPAVALTGYARVEDRVRALDAGFQTHASKPIEPAELVAVVASLTRAKAEPLAGSTALAR